MGRVRCVATFTPEALKTYRNIHLSLSILNEVGGGLVDDISSRLCCRGWTNVLTSSYVFPLPDAEQEVSKISCLSPVNLIGARNVTVALAENLGLTSYCSG